jgi:cell division transport system permease protein
MRALAKSLYSWRSALQGFRRTPFVHGIAVAAIAMALFLAGLTRGAMQLVDSLLATASHELALTVYLREGTTSERAREIADSLAAQAGVSAAVVPPEAALRRLRTELGDLGDVLDDLPKNPLPLTIELRFPSSPRPPEKFRSVADNAKSLPEVAAVDYGQEAVEELAAIASALRYAALVAFGVAAVATVIIVAATLQLAIHSRRSEIEIQKLVGATARFLRAPFLIEGVIQGLVGSLVAILALRLFSWLLGPRLVALFSFLAHPTSHIALPTAALSMELAICGCILGLGGSFAAVRRLSQV